MNFEVGLMREELERVRVEVAIGNGGNGGTTTGERW